MVYRKGVNMKVDISKLDLEYIEENTFERVKSKNRVKKFSSGIERNRKELTWKKTRRHHSRNR